MSLATCLDALHRFARAFRLATASAGFCLSACAAQPPKEYPPADTNRWARVGAEYNSSDLLILSVDGTATSGGLSHARGFVCENYRNCRLSDTEPHSLEVRYSWNDLPERGELAALTEGLCLLLIAFCVPVVAVVGPAVEQHHRKAGTIGECRASLHFTPAPLGRYALRILLPPEVDTRNIEIIDTQTGETRVVAPCQ